MECRGIFNQAKKIANSPIQKRLSKKVVSGQPTGPNIMWLCDKGEFTHATIKGEKKPSQSNPKKSSQSNLKKNFLVKSHSHHLTRKNTDYAVQHMGGVSK